MVLSGKQMHRKQITIDIISDFVCPWCYVGRNRLASALELLPDVSASIRWRPYQLDPTLPCQGKDRKTYLREKFGSESRAHDMHRSLIEVGEEAGIEFDFEAIQRAPNSFDAHRLVYWVSQSDSSIANRLTGILFSYYFEQGKDIGEHSILIEAATESGFEGDVAARLLASNADADTIRSMIDSATQIGVTGVPCFILDQKYAVMGAQSSQILADAIAQTADGYQPTMTEDR